MRRTAAVCLLPLLLVVACGPGDEHAAATPDTTPSYDTSRVVVLNGDLTEIVFALGQGDRVVATDSSATFPAEAVALPKIGYQRSLNAEGILAQEPTLVLATTDAGPPAVLQHLRSAGVAVEILEPRHDLDGVAAKIRAVGRALGVPDDADDLARSVQRRLDTVVEHAQRVTGHPTVAVLYLRGANTQLLFGRDQGANAIAEAVGAVSAVDAASTIPLTPEALVAAQPDALIVTTSGLESVGGVDGLLKVPGVAETPAGRDRRILAYDDQMLLGFGPRLADCLEQLITDLHEGTP